MEYLILPSVIVAAIIASIVWAVSVTNGFKMKEIRIKESLSGVEVALTKRYDMLTKLLDTTKGYMAHEKEIFSETVKLRKGMSVDELNQAEQKMAEISSKVFAVAEGYPELRSSDVFIELQRGIRDAEEHLQAARRLFNSNVKQYNIAITMFPSSLLAKGRTPYEFFEAEERKRADIEIKF